MLDENYAFGSFQLMPGQRLLLDNGRPLRLGSRALDILIVLLEAAGETVHHDQLMTRAWPAMIVDEASLRVHIAALRKTLGEGRAGNRFIASIPGRGYAFVAPVTRGEGRSLGPSPAAGPVGAGNLPTPLASIVGRSDAIASLAAQLTRRRLLTLVGPGGIGKTTVAVAIAESVSSSYPDGVWLVPLASLPAPSLVPSAVATAVGVGASGTGPSSALAARLQDKQALIVLDNCEHVIEAAAEIAEMILRTASRVRVLATSREPLRAEGEWLHRLPPLEIPPERAGLTADEALSHSAARLFSERALECGSDFSLSDADVPALCEICRKLDGLPLAIELEVQVEVLGIQDLARALNHRFAILTRGRRTALARQQTLRATIDWSHDLLSETEKAVFRRLGIFRGDFTMDAARAVVGDGELSGAAVVDCVANLAAKSLVATDSGGDVTYHRLIDTTRAYVLEKLTESVEIEALHRRHAQYYRDLFEPAEAESETRPQAEWLAVYGRHLDNVRVALDWAFSAEGDRQIGVALAIAVVPLWVQLSLLDECRERAQQALGSLPSAQAADARSRMQLSAALGWALMYGVGRAREAGPAWTTTLELAERLDDTDYRQRALWGLCIDQFNNGEFRAALGYAQRFADLVGDSSNAVDLIMGDRILATALHYLGDQRAARHHIERVLTRLAALAQQPQIIRLRFDMRVSTHYFQARLFWLQGFADQALQVVERNIEEGRAIDHALSFCSVLGQGACPIALFTGDVDAAARYGAMLLEHTERHPVRLWNVWARCFNGLVSAKRGSIDAGLQTLRDGLEEAGEAKFLPRFLLLLGELASCLGDAGETTLALETVDQALSRCERRDEGWYIAELLRIKGQLFLVRPNRGAAAQAEKLFLSSLDRAGQQGALSWELRTATSLARLWKERRRLTEARSLLMPIYARFTEGFATADLRSAKTLLEELDEPGYPPP